MFEIIHIIIKNTYVLKHVQHICSDTHNAADLGFFKRKKVMGVHLEKIFILFSIVYENLSYKIHQLI